MSERQRDSLDDGLSLLGIDKLSHRRQGALLGGAVAALIFLTPIGIKSSIDSKREQDAAKQEQKAYDRVWDLAKKYDVDNLSQDSQAAFWRLVALDQQRDVGTTDGNYFDVGQTGEWLQGDIAILNAEIVRNGGTTNEYDLAKELIPQATLGAMKEAGFELTPLEPIPCDVGPVPSYRPFDYSGLSGRQFKVRFKKDGTTINIPLGARQTPVKTEPYQPSPFYFPANPPINSALGDKPRDPEENQLSPGEFYKVAGCETLPRQLDNRKNPVKWVYSG